MPAKRRTNKDANAQNDQEQAQEGGAAEKQTGAQKGSEALPQDSEAHRASTEGTLAKRGWKKRQMAFWTPPIPPATGIGVGTGTGWFVFTFATDNLEPGFVWPSVVLIGMGMAYDLGRRVVDRWG